MHRCGLGGAESENVHGIRARSKIKTGLSILAVPKVLREMWFFGQFGGTLHPLGTFGDHLGVTLCTWGALWKGFGVFSKNIHFSNRF